MQSMRIWGSIAASSPTLCMHPPGSSIPASRHDESGLTDEDRHKMLEQRWRRGFILALYIQGSISIRFQARVHHGKCEQPVHLIQLWEDHLLFHPLPCVSCIILPTVIEASGIRTERAAPDSALSFSPVLTLPVEPTVLELNDRRE